MQYGRSSPISAISASARLSTTLSQLYLHHVLYDFHTNVPSNGDRTLPLITNVGTTRLSCISSAEMLLRCFLIRSITRFPISMEIRTYAMGDDGFLADWYYVAYVDGGCGSCSVGDCVYDNIGCEKRKDVRKDGSSAIYVLVRDMITLSLNRVLIYFVWSDLRKFNVYIMDKTHFCVLACNPSWP